MTPLRACYRALLRRFGPQHWWPAETPFEVMVGAILTQNTAWTNVERAIAGLKAARLLSPRAILEASPRSLARAIRPAGYFNVKTKRLKNFVRWYLERAGGRIERLKGIPPARLREELLGVSGIGPETADSMLLYALDVPTFVVDAYTRRVLSRHGMAPEGAAYEDVKAFFETRLRRDARLFNEFHALFVAVGKEFCRPTPRCAECPLRKVLR